MSGEGDGRGAPSSARRGGASSGRGRLTRARVLAAAVALMDREGMPVADAHPALLPLVIARPLSVPLARRPTSMLQLNERFLGLIGRGGFDGAEALWIYRALVGWILGYLLVDKRQIVDNPDEPEPLLRLGLHRLPAAEYPRLRALAPLLSEHDAPAELAAGLDILLEALTAGPWRPGAARAEFPGQGMAARP
ncbi:hypothetical protein [Kitasatospora paranensis]|uniref:TetR family transcriptional regulator n=1 Tax=Kitasatospora paranensis TaxID=258053 RepID=A0ABW2FUI3_9ACTN